MNIHIFSRITFQKHEVINTYSISLSIIYYILITFQIKFLYLIIIGISMYIRYYNICLYVIRIHIKLFIRVNYFTQVITDGLSYLYLIVL